MEGERILGAVYGATAVIGRLGFPRWYDLIFTDRRLVGVTVAKAGTAMLIGGALGGMVGSMIGRSIAKRGADSERAAYAGRPLDDVVASDSANFAIPYNRLENLQLKGLVLRMTLEGKKAVFSVPRDQWERFYSLITASIPGARPARKVRFRSRIVV